MTCILSNGVILDDLGGLTENDGHENDGPSKLQDTKLQDMKKTDQVYVFSHEKLSPSEISALAEVCAL